MLWKKRQDKLRTEERKIPTWKPPIPEGLAEERIFLKRDGVKVTNIRVLIQTDTYALANMTSCRARTVEKPITDTRYAKTRRIVRAITWFFIIATLIIAVRYPDIPEDYGNPIFDWTLPYSMLISAGLFILMLIINWFLRDREGSLTVHKIFFGNLHGETEAYETQDKSFVDEILKAVNEAILYRG